MFGPTDIDLERLVDELWCGNHGLGDVSRFLLRALDNDEGAARVRKIPSRKVIGPTAKAVATGSRKGWASASPRTFASSTRAQHERQQTAARSRSFMAVVCPRWPREKPPHPGGRGLPAGGERRLG